MNKRDLSILINEVVKATMFSIVSESIYDDLRKSNPEVANDISALEMSGELPVGYAKWAAKQLKLGFDKAEILAASKEFDKIKHRLDNKDLYAYTLPKVEKAIQSVVVKEPPKSQKVFEDDKWLITQLFNKEAAIKYGKNTKWCISGLCDNKFDEYSEEGSLFYVVINKATQEHYAISKDSEFDVYFWDAQDEQIGSNELPSVFTDEYFQDVLMDLLDNEDLFSF